MKYLIIALGKPFIKFEDNFFFKVVMLSDFHWSKKDNFEYAKQAEILKYGLPSWYL